MSIAGIVAHVHLTSHMAFSYFVAAHHCPEAPSPSARHPPSHYLPTHTHPGLNRFRTQYSTIYPAAIDLLQTYLFLQFVLDFFLISFIATIHHRTERRNDISKMLLLLRLMSYHSCTLYLVEGDASAYSRDILLASECFFERFYERTFLLVSASLAHSHTHTRTHAHAHTHTYV